MTRQTSRARMVEADATDTEPVVPVIPGSVKLGDTVDLPGPSSYVRTPDGSVVTARQTYTFRHTGEHVVTTAGTGTETTVEVTEK